MVGRFEFPQWVFWGFNFPRLIITSSSAPHMGRVPILHAFPSADTLPAWAITPTHKEQRQTPLGFSSKISAFYFQARRNQIVPAPGLTVAVRTKWITDKQLSALCGQGCVGITGYSSVGRASDCRVLQQSGGPWFDSGWPDFVLNRFPLVARSASN